MRERFKTGSVVFDRRRKTWNFLTWEDGRRKTRRIGTLAEYPSKSAARRAASASQPTKVPKLKPSPTVRTLVEQYRIEKMPKRLSTSRSYEVWLRNHILPRWGAGPLRDVQARPVELWLASLDLSPKSRVHIRGLLRSLWDYAQWRGDVPAERNPMELVTVRGATKRTTPPRSLTTDEFHKFAEQLWEPFKTIALVCLCFGLRISECLGLRWSDINWLGGTLCVERGIVRQRVDETKTTGSRRIIPADAVILDVLKRWRQMTEFSADADWVFASPAQLGRLPWSYPRVLQVFQKAAAAAGVGRVSTHTMRHSFRSWLDAAGASLAAQKTLMRHASISTTMDIYGGQTATPEMSRVSGKVAGLAVNGLHADCKPI